MAARPDVDEATLTRAITDAALRILQLEGPEALSFRRIASELGVSHTTVHRHSGSFDGLLELCAERLATELPTIDPALPWAVAAEHRFVALYEVQVAHASLIVLQRGRPWLGPEMMRRFSEPAVAGSLAAGMTFTEVTGAHQELYMYTVGCVLTASSYEFDAGRRAIAALDPADCPELVKHLPDFVANTSNREIFLRGLRHLIAALDPRQQSRSRSRAKPAPGSPRAPSDKSR